MLDLAAGSARHPLTVGGNSGTPLPTSPVSVNLPTQVGNMNFGVHSDGKVYTFGKTDVTLPTGNGAKVPVNVRAPITGASAGKALAKFMKRGLPIISTGMAIYDLMNELGLTATPNAETGEMDISQSAAGYTLQGCTGPGSAYPYNPIQIACPAGVYTTAKAAADALVPIVRAMVNNNPGCNFKDVYEKAGQYPNPAMGGVDYGWVRVDRKETPQGFCTMVTTDYQYALWLKNDSQQTPMTEQQVADMIAEKSGWPTSSAISRALADAVNAGEKVDVGPAIVTGPSTAAGPQPKVTTTTSSDGKQQTKTETTTYNITYNNNTVNVTSTTTTQTSTSITNNGNTTTTTETTTEDKEPEDESKCDEGATDLSCAQMDTPEGTIPKRDVALTYAAEALGLGGGSCPADKVVQLHDGRSIKVFDFVKACEMTTTYVRPLVLALAAFICFLILMPGSKTS